MKLRKIIALVATLGLGAAFASHGHSAEFPKGSPAFVTTYDAALKAAKEGGKPVVMIFSASWCPPCQANKNNVYPSAEVTPFHDKFVWAYLDADQQANVPAMRKFGVEGIPHIQFLSKDGVSLGKLGGGTTPQDFAATLAQVLGKAAGTGGSGSKGSGTKL